MGKIQVGSLVGEVRRKVGNLIYSRNQGGAYTKAYAVPTNPNTTFQQDARFRFFTVQNLWGSITEAQRQAWIAAAPDWPIMDNIGNMIVLSGYDLFMRLNLNLSIIGAATIDTPVPQQPIPALTEFGFNADLLNGIMNVVTDVTAIPADHTLVIALTAAMPATQNYIKDKLRVMYQFNPGENPNADNIVFVYLARFGQVPVTGEKVGCRGYYINNNTGQMGVRYTNIAIST